MNQQPMIVHYVDWNVVLKCKSNKPMDEVLKSIWTEEYANPIEEYNIKTMVNILGYAIEEVVPIPQRAFLLAKILNNSSLRTDEALLRELYEYLRNLQVRDSGTLGGLHDLYVIERKGKYYTIAQYDELLKNEGYV